MKLNPENVPSLDSGGKLTAVISTAQYGFTIIATDEIRVNEIKPRAGAVAFE
jgi:hypothetical protein